VKLPAPGVEVKGNITAIESKQMGVDPRAMGQILRTLSRMYSDPWLALVREYSANALDSHREAGNTAPILITSPSHFEPNFVVQDFGVGLSKEGMLNVYSGYGTSTKRGCDPSAPKCNDGSCDECQRALGQIGAFGIGSKSAFAVAPQFIVSAVKDGMMTVALFKLNDDAAPTVDIMAHAPADLPDGVRVEVGVSDVTAVQNAIAQLFQTWPQGTVMVDGVEVESLWNNMEKLADDVHLSFPEKTYGTISGHWKVVMGGVAYSLPQAVIASLPYREQQVVQNVGMSKANVYLTVPIGAVDITPSREELMVSEKTTATVQEMISKFHAKIGGWVTEQISDSKSQIEAIISYHYLRDKLGRSNVGTGVTWNGKPIPSRPVDVHFTWFRLAQRGYYGNKSARRERDLSLHPDAGLRRILFVTGVPDRRERTVQLAAREFLDQQDVHSEDRIARVVAVNVQYNGGFTEDWFDITDPAVRTMSFDDFAKYKPAPAPRGSGTRSSVRYELPDGTKVYPAELNLRIAKGEKVYYLTAYERPNYNYQNSLAFSLTSGNTLVLLSGRQERDPFLRRVPGALSLPDQLRLRANAVLGSITQADRDAIGASSFLSTLDFEVVRWMEQHQAAITNPGVLDIVRAYTRADSLRTQFKDRIDLITAALRVLNRGTSQVGKSSFDHGLFERTMKGLPLLSTYFLRAWMRSPAADEHAVAYVNLAATL